MAHSLSMIISEDLRKAQYLMNSELYSLLKGSEGVYIKYRDENFEITVKPINKKSENEDPETNLDYMEGRIAP